MAVLSIPQLKESLELALKSKSYRQTLRILGKKAKSSRYGLIFEVFNLSATKPFIRGWSAIAMYIINHIMVLNKTLYKLTCTWLKSMIFEESADSADSLRTVIVRKESSESSEILSNPQIVTKDLFEDSEYYDLKK